MNLAKYLHKRFLGQIFSFAWVFHHAQAKGVDTSTVESINEFECCGITLLSKPNCLAEIGVVGVARFFFSHAEYRSKNVPARVRQAFCLLSSAAPKTRGREPSCGIYAKRIDCGLHCDLPP